MSNTEKPLYSYTFTIPLPSGVRIEDGFTFNVAAEPNPFNQDVVMFDYDNTNSLPVNRQIVFKRIDTEIEDSLSMAAIVATKHLSKTHDSKARITFKGYASVALVSVLSSDKKSTTSSLSDMFDEALILLRRFLKNYYMVHKDPIQLPSRLNLPSTIVVFTNSIQREGRPAFLYRPTLSAQLLILNSTSNLFINSSPPLNSIDTLHLFDPELTSRQEVFNPIHDTFREATLAHNRGESLSACILYASNIEVTLDTVLMYMLWEEGKRPDHAHSLLYQTKSCDCKYCNQRVTTTLDRVLNGTYRDRIGGDWSRNSKIMKHWRSVAETRNRAVHTGKEPNLATVDEIRQATIKVTSLLLDLLTLSISKYPLTALFFAGSDGLTKRGVSLNLSDHLSMDEHTLNPISHSEHFIRWNLEVEKIKSKKLRGTTDKECNLAYAIHPSGRNLWILYNPAKQIFRILGKQEVASEIMNTLNEIETRSRTNLKQTVIVDLPGVKFKASSPRIIWHNMYLLSSSTASIDRWPTSYLLPEH